MTDPLLTIEDATREFRVSPKTIRRRLTSGEIDGAYKRPGNRGPEWVMPRDSLAAAGFTPRSLAAPATLPSDAEERASYWEQRAVDAEAAMRSTAGAKTPRSRPHLGGLGWAFIGVSVLIALLAGSVVLRAGGDAEDAAPRSAGAMALVVELLEGRTDPGDAIGLVGERRTDALPAGRVAAPSPRDGWESATGPRFVVATFDDQAVPAAVRALRGASEVLLRAPHNDMVVEVYDRRSPSAAETSEVASPATKQPEAGDAPRSTVTEPPKTEPADQGGDTPAAEPGTPPAPAAPPGTIAPAEAPSPTPGAIDPTPAPTAPPADPEATPSDPATQPSATGPGEVQVDRGESFWSIAEDVVTAELGADASEAAVTAYWSTLVGANADRLVEPGNPDLLHVGQTIVLPSVT